VVFAARDARTVFGTYGKLNADRAWNNPAREDVLSSRIVCVDPFFGDASLQVARWCREAAIPYVTVDTAPDSEMARHAEVLVISEEFAAGTFGPFNPHEMLAAYAARGAGLVILTRGSERLLYGRDGEQPKEHAPFAVDVRDTTGAGDSFRAGIIYGMLRGYPDDRLIDTASAVAALVCQGVPGVLNSPTMQELEEFLSRQP
jgi:sugar/nucleoside kinase (ribokinase family)